MKILQVELSDKIFEKLKIVADVEFRTPEQQLVYCFKNFCDDEFNNYMCVLEQETKQEQQEQEQKEQKKNKIKEPQTITQINTIVSEVEKEIENKIITKKENNNQDFIDYIMNGVNNHLDIKITSTNYKKFCNFIEKLDDKDLLWRIYTKIISDEFDINELKAIIVKRSNNLANIISKVDNDINIKDIEDINNIF